MNNDPTAAASTAMLEPALSQTASGPAAATPSSAPLTQPAPSSVAPAAPAQPASASAGWRTTEFWMTALSHVGLLLAASAGALPPQYAAIAIAASQVAYNLSRGMAKQNSATAALVAAR